MRWAWIGVVAGLGVASAEELSVVTYPGPGAIPASDRYAVRVEGRESFTYKTNAQVDWGTRALDAASWTTFDFAGGPVTVEVRKLVGEFGDVTIRPTSAGLTATRIDPRTIRIRFDRPRKVSVEGSGDPRQALFLFAGSPDLSPPRPGDAGVVYWGPGVHEIGDDYRLRADTTYYLAGGAWLKGQFRGGGAGTRIAGRGVLSSGHLPHVDGPGAIHLRGEGIRVEGITVVESPGWTIGGGTDHRDVRVLCWLHNTDGITTRAGAEASIRDCFVMNYDDVFIVGGRALTIADCVLYPLRGSCFQLSWNVERAAPGPTVVRNIDVIHFPCDEDYDGVVAVFSMNHGGRARLGNITFEGIRVESLEGSVRRFCSLRLATNPWSRVPAEEIGGLDGVTFRDVTIRGRTEGNRILGLGPEQRIANVRFEDLVIDGRPIRDAKGADLSINEHASGITFATRADADEAQGPRERAGPPTPRAGNIPEPGDRP